MIAIIDRVRFKYRAYHLNRLRAYFLRDLAGDLARISSGALLFLNYSLKTSKNSTTNTEKN